MGGPHRGYNVPTSTGTRPVALADRHWLRVGCKEPPSHAPVLSVFVDRNRRRAKLAGPPARFARTVSQQVLERQALAVVKTRQEVLLRVLETLRGSPVPADVAALVQASADPEQLLCWFDAALKVASYDEFRAATS